MDYGINERDVYIDKHSGKDFNRKGYLPLKENVLRSRDTLVVKELLPDYCRTTGLRPYLDQLPDNLKKEFE